MLTACQNRDMLHKSCHNPEFCQKTFLRHFATRYFYQIEFSLHVHFTSLLVGINIAESWLNEVASILNCKVGKVSFLYMGLFIGGNSS